MAVVGNPVALRQNATGRVWPQIQSHARRRMFRAEFRSRVTNTRFLLSERSHSSHTRHRNRFVFLSSCAIFTRESSFEQLQQSFDVRNSLIETVSKCREIRRCMPIPLVGIKWRTCIVRLQSPYATSASSPYSCRIRPIHLSSLRLAAFVVPSEKGATAALDPRAVKSYLGEKVSTIRFRN